MAHRLPPYYCVNLIGLLLVSFFASGCVTPNPRVAQPLIGGPAVSEVLKRAQAGDPNAQNELGLLYSEGRGLPQNYLEAKDWLDRKSTRLNSSHQR